MRSLTHIRYDEDMLHYDYLYKKVHGHFPAQDQRNSMRNRGREHRRQVIESLQAEFESREGK